MDNERQKEILIEVSSIAIGEIPENHLAFGQLCWKLFNMGIQYENMRKRKGGVE